MRDLLDISICKSFEARQIQIDARDTHGQVLNGGMPPGLMIKEAVADLILSDHSRDLPVRKARQDQFRICEDGECVELQKQNTLE